MPKLVVLEGPNYYFFINQEGVVFYATKPFEVDKKTCEVPKGLVIYGR
jgi:hypothetical protein